jgi:hypothetical protein
MPAGVHVSIVSPLVNDVRHIAVPSLTRSLETLICGLFRDSGSVRPGLHSVEEIGGAGGDVVAGQAHPFDAVDAAFGGFVGVPVFEACVGHWVDAGFTSERDHEVDVNNELPIK